MSKLNVDQKSIHSLFSDKKTNFLIPDYQRPYAWEEEQCQTLWADIFEFAFPDDNHESFNDDDEYFLGSIVTFKNEEGQSEVIDGQQRLTTLLLILRAFYDKFERMQDKESKYTRARIEECIWKTDTFGEANKDQLKLDSEVATDEDKEEFLELLRTGKFRPDSKSQYVRNFQLFQNNIDGFLNGFPSYFPYLPARILNNCILLPIEAESQDTALRIFSTLNDRGLPLSDSDIFKAQFYKRYNDLGKKDDFIKRWKNLESITEDIFRHTSGTPMDELFTRYMYFLRAKAGVKTTTEALRKFYEKNQYSYLKQDHTIDDLEAIAKFWSQVHAQNDEYLPQNILEKLFVLAYSPNSMWQHLTTVYFLANKGSDDKLEEQTFGRFLNKIIAFTFAYAVINPGISALRIPAFDEMVNIGKGVEVTFDKYRFTEEQIRRTFQDYRFSNRRPITRSMLTWYAFTFEGQELLTLSDQFDIEHIYARKRQEMEGKLEDERNLDRLGNKILLEKSINIRASDYSFEAKKSIYSGEIRRGKNKKRSQIAEIAEIVQMPAFNEEQIEARDQEILDRFCDFLRQQGLFII